MMDKNYWVVLEIHKNTYYYLKSKFGGFMFFREDNNKYYVKMLNSVKNKIYG